MDTGAEQRGPRKRRSGVSTGADRPDRSGTGRRGRRAARPRITALGERPDPELGLLSETLVDSDLRACEHLGLFELARGEPAEVNGGAVQDGDVDREAWDFAAYTARFRS